MTIYGVYSLLLSLDHVGVLVSATVQLAIAVLMVMVALSAAPSYLRYKNILRDRAQETAAALDMNHYIWWTWPGWGETAYPISRYIERSHAGPVTVAFDYLEPFYKPPGQRWVKADFSQVSVHGRTGTIAGRIEGAICGSSDCEQEQEQ